MSVSYFIYLHGTDVFHPITVFNSVLFGRTLIYEMQQQQQQQQHSLSSPTKDFFQRPANNT
jgi:hypothetical protein